MKYQSKHLSKNLLKSALDYYNVNKEKDYVVSPAIPILFFGDIESYNNSGFKVVTVGLNPSNTEFRLSFDSDFLPAKVDPIAADLIKKAVANNLESKGHTMTEDAPILVKLTISNEEKIQNDTNFYSYPYYYRYPYPYDYDRIRLIDEYYLRVL